MVKERIAWMDLVKLMAIWLVVWGHVISFMGGLDKNAVMHEDPIWVHIYAFHMPLFMTISGFFSYKIVQGQANIMRKFTQLIVPCISLGLLCLVVGIDCLNFWYLKSLFLCYVIWTLFFRWFRGRLTQGLALFGLASLVFFPLITRIPLAGSYKVDFMLPFFGLGLLLAHYKEFVGRHLKPLLAVSALLCAVGLYMWDSSFIWYFSKPLWIDYKTLLLDHQLVIDTTTLWQTLARYAVGGCTSLFILFLFWSVNKRLRNGGVKAHLPATANTPCTYTYCSRSW